MQIERQEIRVFAAVVEAGAIGRAAEQLGISQSAVSQAVAKLEHKVGTALLLRKPAVRLTEAGIRFLKFAQGVIVEEQHTLQDIRAIRSGALSTLSLAMSGMTNRIYGNDLLLKFCDDNPFTRLQLTVAPSQEIIYGVDDGRWELGFGPFQHNMPGHFTARSFFTEQHVLVVHESHPQRTELLAAPQGLVGQLPLITSYLDEVAKRPGLSRLRHEFATVWEVSHLELRLALVKSGKGITYVTDKVLATLDGFVPIPGLDISTIERDVGLYYKTDGALSEGAKRFSAICHRYFLPDPD